MSKATTQSAPPDQFQRQRALDSARSILVQAPAGSGKTDLLTRRFLRLLAEVEAPGQVVAITFTNAAAAEMRHRILSELEKAAARQAPVELQGAEDPEDSPSGAKAQATFAAFAARLKSCPFKPEPFSGAKAQVDLIGFTRGLKPPSPSAASLDEFSMEALAHRALKHSDALGWKLLDLPAQLRISTIDSFCRELALQQPLLSGLGGGLEIAEQPDELYRRAARETLQKIDLTGSALGAAIEELLLWRDNGWQEMEALLIAMLKSRDRWMHGFVLEREPDWDALRERLERPFAKAVRDALIELSGLLDQVPGAREEALELARFACEQSGGQLHQELAELVEFPSAPFAGSSNFEEARQAHVSLAALLLTGDGDFRRQVDKRMGFPADRKREKGRLLDLIAQLAAVPGFGAALAGVRALPPARYTEEEWRIVRSCFTLLRQAAGEVQIAFAEAGRVDFTEVAQIAQRVLRGEDGLPTDAALAVSDNIRHLLVDEFQDTSRRQHQLLSSLIAAWPEREGRTCFVVGDPMQSIYFFRDADAELFPRVKAVGLEVAHDEPLLFDSVSLTANFRTAPGLVKKNNEIFVEVFATNDGSVVTYSSAEAAREEIANAGAPFSLHLDFVPQAGRGQAADSIDEKETARTAQIDEIVALIRGQMSRIEAAKASGEKFRIAVLGRARTALAPVAAALREAGIPFRAVDLEKLATRPEVLDALALARALLNPEDRVAWLGVLRAPWCGLSLDDLNTLAGEPESLTRPVPELLAERLPLLSDAGRPAAARVLEALAAASDLRAAQPTVKLGSWLEAVWLLVGGAACVDETARANLNLLWSCLDRLPGGEEDLLGPGLGATLDKLTALPDPASSSDCGVQLMTIHKSKGLEFEVVIVPELHAAVGRGGRTMLSWLERGLAQPGDSGEITEFLIAPFQRKGEERGSAKAWVDRVYRERESQEARRILYVAATRAREELHLFARPACKEEDWSYTLVEPAGSLLATAWPALEEEVRARFAEWKAERAAAETGEDEIASIAASAESNLLVMPPPIRPTVLRRLPTDYRPTRVEDHGFPPFPQKDAERMGHPSSVFSRVSDSQVSDSRPGPPTIYGSSLVRLYTRHEGGLLSRALGTAVHALLEELARLRLTQEWEAARAAIVRFEPRVAAQVRAVGVDQAHAASVAAQALQLALNASRDPLGSWILSPHRSAASEAGWAGVVGGSLRSVRVDRVFQAGPTPGSEGEDCWWIIDYKTAHADNLDLAKALPMLRSLFAPQVEAYGEVLRKLHGADPRIFAGLYYPRMALLDWWEL
jgi:ATP-dependent exoDNAse (exonuclease V) beta subunit